MTQTTWTREDHNRAEQKLEELSQRAHRPLSLENLLERWTDFVSAVERGFDEALDDYTNELTVRDLIEEVRVTLTEGGQAYLDRSLRPLDERFEQVTRTVDKPLLPGAGGAAPGQWWYRVPQRPGEELRQALDKR